MPHELTLLRDIALGIVFAALAAHVARLIRQPLILGYIAGGVLLSPRLGLGLVTSVESIELISEIGLILLLFIIGLEIDLRELRRLGRSMLALGVGQFVINALLGLVFFSWLGYRATGGNFDLLYLAIVISLSSTLIVVKLLRDKFELKVLSGRLTLGVLVVQDIWAIVFMAVQPSLADPGVLTIARSIAGGAVLVAAAFLASRYVLSRLFEAAARRPELVLISAVAWCFVRQRRRRAPRPLARDGRPDRGRQHLVVPVRLRRHLQGDRRPRLLRHPLLRGARHEGTGAERASSSARPSSSWSSSS